MDALKRTPGISVEPAPLISVVIPTHNRSSLLRRSIQSVLAQTFRDFELFVVDDASTDDTSEMVRGFSDPRLHYIRLEKNRRAAAARNVGIGQARGQFLAFQDDDDIWLPHKLETQLAELAKQPASVGLNLCGHIKLSSQGALYVGGAERFEGIDFSQGMNWKFGLIATPAWLVRREALERAGLFDEGMKAWDDWELALRLRDACEFSHTEEPLFIQDQRRSTGPGMWDNEKNYANDMGIIMQKHGHRWKDSPRVLAHHYMMMGRSEYWYHSVAEGRRLFWRAFRASPSPKSLAFYLLSHLGRGAIPAARKLVRALRGAAYRLLPGQG